MANKSTLAERARIAAWLRVHRCYDLAEAVERGDHTRPRFIQTGSLAST